MTDLGATSTPTYRERQISANTTSSRPLSEISDNNNSNNNGEHRRSTTRDSLKTRSRPSSEVKDFAPEREAKRASITMQHTITLNLNDYASSVAKRESPLPSPNPPSAFDALSLSPQKTASGFTFGPWAEPPSTEKAGNGVSPSVKGKEKAQVSVDQGSTANPLDRQPPNPPPAAPLNSSQPSLASPIALASTTSFGTSRSSIDVDTKSRPSVKPKPPQWLRKASGSGLAALRSKSRSPKGNDEPLPAVPSLPPALPPRKNQSASTADRGAVLPPTPPPVPQKPLDLSETQARPDRSSTVGPADRPAPPARKASRDNIGRRIAAWTANAHSAFPRSASSASLTSQASTQSTFNASHQRSHSQAQKVLDGAGAAMQKGLAGLKARGMSGSISSLSSIGGNGRAQHTRQGSAGPSSGWTSGFGTRSSKDHARSTTGLASTSEGPEFEDAIVMRLAIPGCRPIFGHDLVEAGNATHVMDANAGDAMERQRRHCLPAVVVRCVEYLEIWGPKEEGIFRISGRSSHIARLKKEFDSGADIDMRQCHPGDLDPHAVAGLFKLYLRDLPSSVLTPQLLPLFDAYGKAKHGLTAPLLSVNDLDREVEHVPDEVDSLLAQLPPAHWFLIADIVKLLDLIPRHEQVNRMTPNALMISLGPSVNIPGGILTEFLTRRKHLFAKPPSTKQDTVTDLIDFGNVDIAPPSIPQATMFPLKPESPLRSSTPHSQLSEDSPPFKVNKPQRMSSKPSLTRLFTASSRNLTQAEEEPVVPPSAVNPEPPRVDLTIDEMSPLPNFGKVPSPVHPPPELPSTSSADDHTPTQETEEKKLEDILHPTPGMVQERIKAYPTSSTPIADRFAKAEAGLPPLRPNSLSSSISTVSAGKASHDNPATIVKRGQSPFFSGPGISPRSSHSRAQSGTLLDKRSSTSSSVREMVRDMERRD